MGAGCVAGVRQVTEEVESKKGEASKGPSKDTGSLAEQQFVRSVIELHDKYLGYVSTCFCKVGEVSLGVPCLPLLPSLLHQPPNACSSTLCSLSSAVTTYHPLP